MSDSYDFPHFMHGHKTIDKQIELILNRSKQENQLFITSDYKYNKLKSKSLSLQGSKTDIVLKNYKKS